MFSTIFRIIKYGILDFKRNIWLATATIAVLVLALMVFSGLYFFNVFTSNAILSVQNKIDISVYFKSTTSEDTILKIQSALKKVPEVKSVQYISKNEALKIFKKNHKNDEVISKALDQIQNNPLLPSINIKAKNPDEYSVIAAYLNSSSTKQFIDNISYSQNATVIKRLGDILRTARRGGIAVTIFVSLIAILIIFNTIRLAIYSSRDSISIMRLVGGSSFFIRGPFLIEAILYAVVATIINILIVAPIIYFISPYSNILVPGFNLWKFFTGNLFLIILYELILSITLGLVSSFFAVSKYLKRQ